MTGYKRCSVCDTAEPVLASNDPSCDGVTDVYGDCYQLHTSHMTRPDAGTTCSYLGFRLVAVQVNNPPGTIP